jgi:hypothetical protein
MKTAFFTFATAALLTLGTSSAFAHDSKPAADASKAAHKTHADHKHQHGKDCGHKAVQHGDHTDYQHDGHSHKIDNDHVDECDSSKKS